VTVERLAKQLAAAQMGALPDGEHLTTLVEVAVVPRKKGGHWLRLISKTSADAYARELRRLSDDEQYPFNLTDGQRRGMIEFAERFGILERDPEAIVRALEGMVGQAVSVEITKNQHRTLAKHSSPSQARIRTQAGTVTVHGEVEVRARTAHASYEKLMDGLNASRLALAVVAEACYELSRENAYRDLGYESLAEFLAQVDLSRSEFFNFASIYERYVLEGGADPTRLQVAGPSKLAIPLPALRDGEVDVDEALADCEELGRKDLRIKYRGESELQESGRPDCSRCAGIPDEVIDELRARYAALGA
jgi:hypothetical protein